MKLHPQARIAFLKKGDRRIGSSKFWNELIKTCNAFRTLRVKSGSRNNFIIADDNAELTIIGTDEQGGGAGWHWEGEFDGTKVYSYQSVVIVSTGNSAIGTTVSGTKKVIAGMYVCVQQTIASNAGTYPCWPLPNSTVSSSSNYWMLISFYPTEMTYCLDGINTQYYVNAQIKP